jgi:carboxylate-amine ligase
MEGAGEKANFLAQLSKDLDRYQTIEAEILQEFPPTSDCLPLDAGLRLVRQCCDKLEAQVSWLDESI